MVHMNTTRGNFWCSMSEAFDKFTWKLQQLLSTGLSVVNMLYSCRSDDIVSLHPQAIILCTVAVCNGLLIVSDLRHQSYKEFFYKEHVSLNLIMTSAAAAHDELE